MTITSVVANVPYYITSAILRYLQENEQPPRRLVLTMQLEVAERLTAAPGDMSILAVSAQFYARTEIAARLKAAMFWPRPDVDSAVVRLDTYAQPPVDVPDSRTFFRVVKLGFSQKRKQLKNSLGKMGGASGSKRRGSIRVAAPKRSASMSGRRWRVPLRRRVVGARALQVHLLRQLLTLSKRTLPHDGEGVREWGWGSCERYNAPTQL